MTRRRFDLLGSLADYCAGRFLALRARRHLADGRPPLAAFAFDFIGREIAVQGQFERDDLDVLSDFLSPLGERFARSTALDVGANIGNHSLFFAQHFATVHAFEPNPRTHAILVANAMLAENITPHNTALGNTAETLTLSFNPLNVGEATLLVNDNVNITTNCCSVQVERLDDISVSLGNVAFIKIDVEGYEPQVLRGALQLLRDLRPVIAFEQNTDAFVGGKSETAQLLLDSGYTLCVIEKAHVSSHRVGQLFGAIYKAVGGVRYDIVAVDTLLPGHYPMIIAVNPADLLLLSRATGR